MQKHSRRLVGGLLATGALALTPSAVSAATNITVRVEGKGSTIQRQVQVTTSSNRSVGLPGKPTCSGLSGLSALDAAVAGNWSGPYFEGLGYAPDTINGRAVDTSNSYFGFWHNRRFSNVGLCDARPKDGDEILLFNTPFTEPAGGLLPLGLRAPKTARAGRNFRVRVVEHSKTGVATPVEGATVRSRRVDGSPGRPPVVTDANGYATVRAGRGRDLLFRAVKAPNRIRSEFETVDIR